MKNTNKVSKIPVLRFALVVVITLVALFAFSTTACSKSGGGSGSGGGGGKGLNSTTELKEYLDKQPANSPDKPIKVAMKVNEMMIESIAEVISEAGKYVSLDLSGSPLTEISSETFSGCSSLAGIIIPDSVTSIGKEAFSRCYTLTSVSIPSSVTSIGEYAFSSCYNLTSVSIPSSVTSIGEYAFSGCYSLTSVSIPTSVISIEASAFSLCNSLASVTFMGTVSDLSDAFRGNLVRVYKNNGPGTYTTANPGSSSPVWTKQ